MKEMMRRRHTPPPKEEVSEAEFNDRDRFGRRGRVYERGGRREEGEPKMELGVGGIVR